MARIIGGQPSQDVMDRLPRECYSVDEVSGKIIRIKRGVEGYFPCANVPPSYNARELADKLNADDGITAYQEEAMVNGSMFGFHVPAADPAFLEIEAKKRAARKGGK